MTAVLGAENIINFGSYTKKDIKSMYPPYFYKYDTKNIHFNFKFYSIKELGLKLLKYPINKEIKEYIENNINMFLPKKYFEPINYLDLIGKYTVDYVGGIYDNCYMKQKNKTLKIHITPTVPDILIVHLLLRNCSFNPDRPEFIINTQIIDKNSMLKIGTNTEVKEVL